MLPEVFEALATLYRPEARGLVFVDPKTGTHFSYRKIQYRYNRAFEKAGLPYRATHIMRHGGTRKTFDETGGDEALAAQKLGNRDRKTVAVYAQRSALAFTEYSHAQWDKWRKSGKCTDRALGRVKLEIVKED